MAFTRVKPLGWALKEILTSAQANALDTNLANAVDGVGGGAYDGTLLFSDAQLKHMRTVSTTIAGLVNGNTANLDMSTGGMWRLQSTISTAATITLNVTNVKAGDVYSVIFEHSSGHLFTLTWGGAGITHIHGGGGGSLNAQPSPADGEDMWIGVAISATQIVWTCARFTHYASINAYGLYYPALANNLMSGVVGASSVGAIGNNAFVADTGVQNFSQLLTGAGGFWDTTVWTTPSAPYSISFALLEWPGTWTASVNPGATLLNSVFINGKKLIEAQTSAWTGTSYTIDSASLLLNQWGINPADRGALLTGGDANDATSKGGFTGNDGQLVVVSDGGAANGLWGRSVTYRLTNTPAVNRTLAGPWRLRICGHLL